MSDKTNDEYPSQGNENIQSSPHTQSGSHIQDDGTSRNVETGSPINEAGRVPAQAAAYTENTQVQQNRQVHTEERPPYPQADAKQAQAAEPKFAEDRGSEAAARHSRFFAGLAHVGPLVLLVAIGLMVWPDFWGAMNGKGYYCPAEVSAISSLLRGIDHHSWIAPAALANSQWIAQWPAYTWLMELIAIATNFPGVPPDVVFPLAATICAFLAALGAWGFAHAARFGSRASFAAALILLCAPLFAPLPHFVGASVLSAALMMLSLALFARGWLRPRAWISMLLAFILCGLAGLSGGLFYLAIPLLASFFFLVWRGNMRRGGGKDAIFGFALLLVLLGGWISAVILRGDDASYLSSLFSAGLRFTWPPQPLWWVVFVIAGFGLLPWLLTILGVSWLHVIAASPASLKASRRDNGSALIWIAIVIACLLAPFFGHMPGVAIALVCLASPLLGKAFINMPSAGNRFFFFLASLLAILASLAMLGLSFSFSRGFILSLSPLAIPDWLSTQLPELSSLPIIGAILLISGIIGMVVYARRDHEGAGLLFSLLVTIIITQPCVMMLVPELAANSGSGLATYADIRTSYNNARIPAAEPATPEQAQAPASEVQDEAASLPPAVTGPEQGSAQPEGQSPATSPNENQPAPDENAAPAQPDAAINPPAALPPAESPAVQDAAPEVVIPPASESPPAATPPQPEASAPSVVETPKPGVEEVIIVEEIKPAEAGQPAGETAEPSVPKLGETGEKAQQQ